MTYTIVAKWRAQEGELHKVEGILHELSRKVREEPGNLQFVVHRSCEDPNEFLLYEQYSSEEAFREHQRTAHFKTLVLERAVPLLAQRERKAYSDLE